MLFDIFYIINIADKLSEIGATGIKGHYFSFIANISALTFAVFLLCVNIFFCIVIIFLEHRNPQSALMWLLMFIFIPIVGFVLYLFFGRNLYKTKLFNKKELDDKILLEKAEKAHNQLIYKKLDIHKTDLYGFESTASFFKNSDNSGLSDNNFIERFIDGKSKFAAFKETIDSAEKYIHLEYFIIRNDELGREIVGLLAKKAREGVKVRAIFDAGGTFTIKKREFFGPLTEAGGDVRIFFPLKIPIFNTRIHFRNHRKILVVDGHTGMIGGFNIGDEYLGKGRLGNWRDTHLRISGRSVADLQKRFIMDWNYAAKDAQIEVNDESFSLYFPLELYNKKFGESKVQIVSSGPDSSEHAVFYGYFNLVSRANQSIYIHTPYFIPGPTLYKALRFAIRAGVDVRIVIPSKADKPFIFYANHSYLGDLLQIGARGYEYSNGFIHSKASIFDGKVFSVGTANWDLRSFKLNFETNAFVYDEKIASEMKEDFLKELDTNCREITLEDYKKRPLHIKIYEGICRLFSPLL